MRYFNPKGIAKFAMVATIVSSTPVFSEEIPDEFLRELMRGPSEATENTIARLPIHGAPIRPGTGGGVPNLPVKNLTTVNSGLGQISNSIGPTNTIPFSIPDTVWIF